MGFWIFMLIFNLVLPLIMVGFGHYFIRTAPKEINSIFGYKTAMSMKNQDTWVFAHNYCGKVWWRLGWALASMSVIGMLFVTNGSKDTVGTAGTVICTVQLIFLVCSIVPTEMALKKTFDTDGKRRNLQ